jgi:hypothetical protein
MKSFKIYNDTKINFGFRDMLRILCGKEVTVSTILHVEKEVMVFSNLTETSVSVKHILKPKPKQLVMPN